MAQRRVKEAEETGAKELVSCCPFCYQGLQVGISSLASDIVMKDMSAYIAESLLGYDVLERADEDAAAKKKKKEEAQLSGEDEKKSKEAASND